MKCDRVYKDNVLIFIILEGTNLASLFKLFNSHKYVIVAIQRALNENNGSDWFIFTTPNSKKKV